MEVIMLNQLTGFVMEYFPSILFILIILVGALSYLLFKEKKERKEERKSETEKEVIDADTVRLHTHILNTIRNLTVDSQELGFTYESDFIQSLLADIPKVLKYYQQYYGGLPEEGIIPVLPCIPENLVPPNQLMAASFLKGRISISSNRMRNLLDIPKRPYWVFMIDIQEIDPKNFSISYEKSLTINELIRTATQYEKIWRSRSNQIIATATLVKNEEGKEIPIVFRCDLTHDTPFVDHLSENVQPPIRKHYLATCASRICFSK